MTLFLLLVTIAALVPLGIVAAEATRLGVLGSMVGLGIAVALGVAQFVGHHRLAERLLAKLKHGYAATWFVGAYYVAILIGGGLCAVVALCVGRAVVNSIP